MAIDFAQVFLPLLDEVYQQGALTADLEGGPEQVTVGENGNKFKIMKVTTDGLGDFSRSKGYASGSTSVSWEEISPDKERSQTINIDRLDNDEALKKPFAVASAQFMRTGVIPETDAARLAKFASLAGTVKEETLSSGADVVSALRTCSNAMDEAEVSTENRLLYITPTYKAAVDDLDTTKSKAILARFSKIIEVPQTRLYTAVTLNSGESSFGYKKAEDGKDMNFICIQKDAGFAKIAQFLKYFTPDEDQNGDSNVFKYRNINLYGYVFDNKKKGVYCSHAAA